MTDGAAPDLTLQFAPFQSAPDAAFFAELGRRKLNSYGLSDDVIDIYGSFSRAERPEISAPFSLSGDAFTRTTLPVSMHSIPGTLLNANTLEEFKELDKADLLEQAANHIWDDVKSGLALRETERLLRFVLLTFADLKSHRYYYWFGFPSFAIDPPPQAEPPMSISDRLCESQTNALRQGYAGLVQNGRAPPFFVVNLRKDGSIFVAELSKYTSLYADVSSETWLAFCDPCSLRSNPGWPLRNLLALAAHMLQRDGLVVGADSYRITALSYREPTLGTSSTITNSATNSLRATSLIFNTCLSSAGYLSRDFGMPARAVGWERNVAGKLGGRLMDLSAQMEPKVLAEASVDLNLKLMRWRLMPELQTDKVASTRCLLMGAGTLGCAVARCLLGWGVRHITFVDSGVVSYSNPVRQTLFNFDDCVSGKTPKAQAAAEALKRIFPSVNASAYRISIPMPGHATGNAEVEQVVRDCDKLSELIQAHDVIFLLTDTRESRWLPSLLSTVHNKQVINAALGFDSLLVMRHGIATSEQDCRLGCYFCNDVVAPANSMLRRTLDQQCTVSRPGLSMIASAMAVELMVTLLHHPDGPSADDKSDAQRSPLGNVPHQIRTSLPAFRNDIMTGLAFDKCTACSPCVVREYQARGAELLLDAFNRASYLEDLTGLTQMHAETEAALEDVTLFDEDDE